MVKTKKEWASIYARFYSNFDLDYTLDLIVLVMT